MINHFTMLLTPTQARRVCTGGPTTNHHYLSIVRRLTWGQVITQLGVDQIQRDDVSIPEHLLNKHIYENKAFGNMLSA